MDETNKTSQAKSYSYKSNLNAKKGACSDASSSEEEDVGILKSRRKGDFEHTDEESNGKSSEEEEIKLPKCGRKGDVKILNEETKKSIGEEEGIGIRKCRRKSRIDTINEEVKGWTSSSNQQEYPPERTNTKEENRLENTTRKLERAALEWDYLDMQAELKCFMYVDCSLRGDPKKDKLIDELNFKKYMKLKRIQKSKFFVGIKDEQRKFIIHPEFMVDNQKLKISLFRISKVTQTSFMT